MCGSNPVNPVTHSSLAVNATDIANSASLNPNDTVAEQHADNAQQITSHCKGTCSLEKQRRCAMALAAKGRP